MSVILRAYTKAFERSPYLTLVCANSLLMSIGDVSAQLLPIAGAVAAFDPERTLRFAVFGASMGPLGGAWNKFLEVNFPLRPIPAHGRTPAATTKVKLDDDFPIPGLKEQLPAGARLSRGGAGAKGGTGGEKSGPGVMQEEEVGVSVAQLAKRVAADQLAMAPVSLFIFLLSMSMLEGLNEAETKQKIRENYWAILSVNWQVWPILQLINFRYVPLPYRVPFGSICGIAWTCFLSWQVSLPCPPSPIPHVLFFPPP
ncbi:hypothetical protein JCM11641_006547 [Rhodosporidiobolus odoratus]